MSSQQTPTPLAIPKQPLDILLPSPSSNTTPNPHTLHLLRELVEDILSRNEVHSVTFSPVLCPVPAEEGGGRNQLFTIKPHWWQTADGKWEWRDGQRNPECARPQGQEQLQSMSKIVHLLCLAIAHLSDTELKQRCVEKLEKLLWVFFLDPETRMEPQVRFTQCQPGEEPMKGNDEMFVIAIRFLILIDQGLLLSGSFIDPRILEQVKEWFNEQDQWMELSEQGMKAKQGRKFLWYHAILASHHRLSSETGSTNLATTSFNDWIFKHGTPEEAFDEPLKHDNRRHRCLFLLEPLFILASLTVPVGGESNIDMHDKNYLRNCVEYLKRVKKGPIEDPLEDDVRFLAKVAWFERILDSREGKDVSIGGSEVDHVEPDGQGWEDGWDKRMRTLWGFI